MKLSLSGRIVELNGTTSAMSVCDFLHLAARCGYAAVDLRASQLNPKTTPEEIQAIADTLQTLKLDVYAGQYGGPLATPEDEKRLVSFAETLKALGGQGIRMSAAVPVLKRASQLVAPLGLKIQYQMHTNSPFETIVGGAQVVREIGEPNFGLIPEPANFALAGLEFTEEMLEPLRGAIAGVHVQTLTVFPGGAQTLTLSDGRAVSYTRVPYAENRCIPFATFFQALRHVGFDGYVNELEPRPGDGNSEAMALDAANFLKTFL